MSAAFGNARPPDRSSVPPPLESREACFGRDRDDGDADTTLAVERAGREIRPGDEHCSCAGLRGVPDSAFDRALPCLHHHRFAGNEADAVRIEEVGEHVAGGRSVGDAVRLRQGRPRHSRDLEAESRLRPSASENAHRLVQHGLVADAELGVGF